MRVLVAGGGTGGHFYPALAVIEGLAKRMPDAEFAFVGTRRGIEARILPVYPWVQFFPVCTRGLVRGRRIQNLFALMWLAVAMLQTAVVFARFRPRLVIGTGGSCSFPPLLLGAVLGRLLPIRTVIHEQNVVAGLTNRLLAPLVDATLLTYPETRGDVRTANRVVVTGNPVREEFLRSHRAEAAYRTFDLDPKRRTVLVFGGSLGSAKLVEQVLKEKDTLARDDDVQVLLVIGSAVEEGEVRSELSHAGVRNVVVRTYIERMGEAFAVADLIVARAGATTLAEITACGKPALVIPWEQAANDHQWHNARALEERDACTLVGEAAIVRRGLVNFVQQLVRDDTTLLRLATNARRSGRRDAKTRVLGEIQLLMRGARG